MSGNALAAVVREELQVPEIVHRYLRGELLDLAAERGVSSRTLYRWMLGGLGDERYHDMITELLVSKVADADVALASAGNLFEVQKTTQQARFARFDLERRRPALYGPKQEVKHSGAVSSGFTVVLLDRPSGQEKTIEGESNVEGKDAGRITERGAGVCEGDGDAEVRAVEASGLAA